MEKKIRIEIELVEGEPNVGCAFYSETDEVLNFNTLEISEKMRITEALGAFHKLFSKGLLKQE